MTLWNKFENNFNNIIMDIKEYDDIYKFAVMYEYNIILYNIVSLFNKINFI